jgi:hypothetical protein
LQAAGGVEKTLTAADHEGYAVGSVDVKISKLTYGKLPYKIEINSPSEISVLLIWLLQLIQNRWRD